MGEVEVEPLDRYKMDTLQTGFPDHEIARIQDEIALHPYFGHQFLDLRHRGVTVPLAGFYVRSWKCRVLSGVTFEACTLHLYLGPSLPIYLFNIASCLEHEVPWLAVKEELSATAETMYFALTKARA